MGLASDFMRWLNNTLSFVNGDIFYLVFSLAIILNPIAVWYQAYKAWTAPSVGGIAATTFVIMLTLQTLASGYGIRVMDPVFLLAMGTSAIGSISVLSALVFRKK